MSNLLSVGGLAKQFGDEVWRIEYILRSRQIKPLAKIGNANIYGIAAARRVEEALNEIHGRANSGDAGKEIAHE